MVKRFQLMANGELPACLGVANVGSGSALGVEAQVLLRRILLYMCRSDFGGHDMRGRPCSPLMDAHDCGVDAGRLHTIVLDWNSRKCHKAFDLLLNELNSVHITRSRVCFCWTAQSCGTKKLANFSAAI